MQKKYAIRRRRGRPVRKRAYRKAGSKRPTVAKLARQVKSLTKAVEVKRIPMSTQAYTTGQVNGNASGSALVDITEMFGTGGGVDAISRSGLRSKAIGLSLRIQLSQMSAASVRSKHTIEIFKTMDVATSVNTIYPRIYDADTISGVIDYNSSRNINFRKLYTRIAYRKISLNADSLTNTQDANDIKIYVKQNQMLEYTSSTDSNPTNVRYFLCIRNNVGNNSTSTACTLPNVVQTAVNTGYVMRFSGNGFIIDP